MVIRLKFLYNIIIINSINNIVEYKIILLSRNIQVSNKDIVEVHNITEKELEEYMKMTEEQPIVIGEIPNNSLTKLSHSELLVELSERMDKIEKDINKKFEKKEYEKFESYKMEYELELQKSFVKRTLQTLLEDVENKTIKGTIEQLFNEMFLKQKLYGASSQSTTGNQGTPENS